MRIARRRVRGDSGCGTDGLSRASFRRDSGDRWRRRRPHLPRLVAILVVVAVVACVQPARARARQTWEYSPYRVHVWLAVRPSAGLPEYVQSQIIRQLRLETRIHAGATWQLSAEKAPRAISSTLVTMLDSVAVDQIATAAADALSHDKLMLLTVRQEQGDYLIACRELDCRTRSFGLSFHARTLQLPHLAKGCARLVARAFAPLVRVEESRGRTAMARVRAGGLVHRDHCVSLVGEGDTFRTVIRRNDRSGKPKPEGIKEIRWTYVVVRERQRQPYLWRCDVFSALRSPLTGRSSARIEKLGLRARPVSSSTRLKLVARSEPLHPLEGYEVFAKKPLSRDSDEKDVATRLGLTDWRGTIEVPPGETPLRLVYVKNGTHLIARLPIVPGYLPRVTAEIPSDDKRLEVEAFVKGMENTVMDLVAQREILAARIERRIDQGKLESARKLLDEMKSLLTRNQLEKMLVNRQQTILDSADQRQQQRIDRLLSGTRILLNKYLSPDRLVALERRMQQAERASNAAGTDASIAETEAIASQ